MTVTSAEAQPASSTDSSSRRRTRGERKQTTLDSHIDRPSVVEPGDAPFDTTDPDERAISVEPDKAAAAAAGFQTVNAVIPKPRVEQEESEKADDRIEKYKVPGPDGKLVSVEHNIDTGETKVS